jgi:hypothetical protein
MLKAALDENASRDAIGAASDLSEPSEPLFSA